MVRILRTRSSDGPFSVDLDDVAAAWPAGTNTPMTVVRLGNGKSFQVYVEYLRFVDLWATAKEGITDA